MDPSSGHQTVYGLVAYINGTLGNFLYNLRQELVPSCRLRSHVSLLPPRLLAGDEQGAKQRIGEVAEQMGHETLAHVSVGGSSHVVRVPGDRAASPGDRLSLGVRPGGVHLFAADDEGRRLN